jgi:hypothetical protein
MFGRGKGSSHEKDELLPPVTITPWRYDVTRHVPAIRYLSFRSGFVLTSDRRTVWR